MIMPLYQMPFIPKEFILNEYESLHSHQYNQDVYTRVASNFDGRLWNSLRFCESQKTYQKNVALVYQCIAKWRTIPFIEWTDGSLFVQQKHQNLLEQSNRIFAQENGHLYKHVATQSESPSELVQTIMLYAIIRDKILPVT
ncbi:MAG: hypothetical protein ACMXYA_02185 [Candidatus Woesearchaeota archaeon]